MFLAIVISLVVGALAVSTFEYKFNYNLIDLIKDKVLGLFASAEKKL